MIKKQSNQLLFVNPKEAASETPVMDALTKKMRRLLRSGSDGPYYKGTHECTGCGLRSRNCDTILPDGTVTNSLAVHYLARHRDEVPKEELEKLRRL